MRIRESTRMMRKLSRHPEFGIQLTAGHLVGLLAEKGPDVTAAGQKIATLPVRFGASQGWIVASTLEAYDGPAPDADKMWKLVQQAAGQTAPAACKPGVATQGPTPVVPTVKCHPIHRSCQSAHPATSHACAGQPVEASMHTSFRLNLALTKEAQRLLEQLPPETREAMIEAAMLLLSRGETSAASDTEVKAARRRRRRAAMAATIPG